MDIAEANKANHGTAASISQAMEVIEDTEMHGRYRVSCTGPVERLREHYCALRTRLGRRGILGWLDRALNGARLLDEFLAIPLEEKWLEPEVPNLVTTVGKNLLLDSFLAGSSYSVVGPYIGLIGSTASSSVVGDTMASHSGWTEVGGANAPTYTSPRKTAAWSAASSGAKSLSSSLSFAITSAGTVGGCFMVLGPGAVSTIDSTAGTLYSAGAFTGGSKSVSSGDTLNVSYTASA